MAHTNLQTNTHKHNSALCHSSMQQSHDTHASTHRKTHPVTCHMTGSRFNLDTQQNTKTNLLLRHCRNLHLQVASSITGDNPSVHAMSF
jgi:hypothetical protein